MQESNWDSINMTTWNQYTPENWIKGNLDQSSVCNMGIKLECARICSMPFPIKHTFSILLTFINMILHFGFANSKIVNSTEGETLPFFQNLTWPLQTNSQLVQVYGKKKNTGEKKVWNVHAVKQGIYSSRYVLNHPSLMLNYGSWHCWLKIEKRENTNNKGTHQQRAYWLNRKKPVLFS